LEKKNRSAELHRPYRDDEFIESEMENITSHRGLYALSIVAGFRLSDCGGGRGQDSTIVKHNTY
jgi:hypothetical protein